jgi:hypothetical protein
VPPMLTLEGDQAARDKCHAVGTDRRPKLHIAMFLHTQCSAMLISEL